MTQRIRSRSRVCALSAIPLMALSLVSMPAAHGDDCCSDIHVPTDGTLQIELQRDALERLGLIVLEPRTAQKRPVVERSFQVTPGASLELLVDDGHIERMRGGEIAASGDLALAASDGSLVLVNRLVLVQDPFSRRHEFSIVEDPSRNRIFDLSGVNFDFLTQTGTFRITHADLRLSRELAQRIGRPQAAGTIVGSLRLSTGTQVVESVDIGHADVSHQTDPPPAPAGGPIHRGRGPDVITCILIDVQQFGRSGPVGSGTVGLAIGTYSTNVGDVPLAWFAMPITKHPVIAQNLYRKSTVDGSTRFEQIGQAWVKHGFCALQLNTCAVCSPIGPGCQSELGPGCADPYSTGLNAGQNGLGARSWIHPFRGTFSSAARNHAGHNHDGVEHRLQVADADLTVAGAAYYAEGHYIALDDSGVGNNFNNVSYRKVNVSGPTGGGTFSFTNATGTIQEQPALNAWATATQTTIDPDPGNDGRAILAYEATDLGGGLWHYEYALYNMNLDDGFSGFQVPVPAGVNLTKIGFHFVPNHQGPDSAEVTGANFRNEDWTVTQPGGSLSWDAPLVPDVENANALRWGALFNFRFDADTPPTNANAVLGLFKTGGTTLAATLGPSAPPVACPGDTDGDNDVDLTDLASVLGQFGQTGAGLPADVNHDGAVDLTDLAIVLGNFGVVCP